MEERVCDVTELMMMTRYFILLSYYRTTQYSKSYEAGGVWEVPS